MVAEQSGGTLKCLWGVRMKGVQTLKCLWGVRMKGVQTPLCVQDVKSRITRGVRGELLLTVDALCVTAVIVQPKKPI